jgi:hypothetical protein
MTAHCLLKRTAHRSHFVLTPDELRKPALCRKVEVRPQPPQASHLVDANRFADAFDLRLAQVAEGEISLAQSPRRLARRD